ncbi:MAG: hypothetical protein KDD55_08000 [Bdellovibrionales bacterium]|nr:hypothetical protein [Bdellovibrionales bacterium]
MKNLLFFFVLVLPFVPSAYGDTTEQFESNVTEPLMNQLQPQVNAFESEVESNVESWASGDDPGKWHLGNIYPDAMFELDHYLLTDLNPLDGPTQPSIPIYTREGWGGGHTEMREIDWTDFAAQTAQCNRIDFPNTHLHTYGALHTQPISYLGFPRTTFALPDHPTIPGIDIGILLAPIEEYLILYDYLAHLIPGSCCFIPCGWSCCKRHTCFETKEYQPFRTGHWGLAAGFCIDVRFVFPSCCPLQARAGHVVDYLFPTHKLNMSRQPLASRYLDYFDVVLEHLPELKAHLAAATAPGFAPLPLTQLQQSLKYMKRSLWGSETLWDLFYMPQFWNYDDLPNNDYLRELSFDPNDLETFVPVRGMNNRGFARFFGEDLVIEDMNSKGHYYPHLWPTNNGVEGQPNYFTDVIDPTPGGSADPKYGLKLSYWMSYSKAHNPDSYEDNDDSHLKMPEKCARMNVTANRTPEDLLLGICNEENGECKEPWEPVDIAHQNNFNDMECLRDVGEVFPLTAKTRPEASDYFFQTFVKGFKQYHSKFTPGSTQAVSFDLSKDRFHIFPGEDGISVGGIDFPGMGVIDLAPRNIPGPDEINDALAHDMNLSGDTFGFAAERCELFDELKASGGRKPWDFHETNRVTEKTIGNHREATLEVFTMFSGCYGFVGESDWDILGLPGVFRLLPSYFPTIGKGDALRLR